MTPGRGQFLTQSWLKAFQNLMQSIPHPKDASNKSSGPNAVREEDFFILLNCMSMGDDDHRGVSSF